MVRLRIWRPVELRNRFSRPPAPSPKCIKPFLLQRPYLIQIPGVQQTVKQLCERLDGLRQISQVIRAKVIFIALTNDVISLFAFGNSWHALDESDFGAYWDQIFATGVRTSPTARIFPPIVWLVARLPTWALLWLNPRIKGRTHIHRK